MGVLFLGRLSPALCLVLRDEEESGLIVVLLFLALDHRLSCFLCVLPLRLCLSRAVAVTCLRCLGFFLCVRPLRICLSRAVKVSCLRCLSCFLCWGYTHGSLRTLAKSPPHGRAQRSLRSMASTGALY